MYIVPTQKEREGLQRSFLEKCGGSVSSNAPVPIPSLGQYGAGHMYTCPSSDPVMMYSPLLLLCLLLEAWLDILLSSQESYKLNATQSMNAINETYPNAEAICICLFTEPVYVQNSSWDLKSYSRTVWSLDVTKSCCGY